MATGAVRVPIPGEGPIAARSATGHRGAAAFPANGPAPRRVRPYVAAAVGYLLAALAVTAPGLAHLSTRVVGHGGDPIQSIWNIAWVGGWLAGRHALFFTRELFFPEGANLAWMTLALPATVPAALLRPLLGLVGAYNAVLLGSLVADGAAMYALARRVGLRGWAAWLSGLTFLASPYLVGEARAHLDLVGAYPLPLAALVLWGILEDERPGAWRFILLGAVIAGAAYEVPDCAVFAVLVALAILVYHPSTRGRVIRSIRARWWGWLLASGTALAAAWPLLHALLAGQLVPREGIPHLMPELFSTDLLGLVIPAPWGLFDFLRPYWHLEVDLSDGSYFPGFAVYGAILVLVEGRRRLSPRSRGVVRCAGWGMAAFGVLSLGPRLHFGGLILSIPLPFAVLAHLPAVGETLPERLSGVVAMFGALLVGEAVQLLWPKDLARSGPGSRTRAGALVLGSLAVLGLVSIPYPFPTRGVPRAAFARAVEQRGGSVLFVPAQMPDTRDSVPYEVTAPGQGYEYMFADAVVGLPTPEGYVSSIPVATALRIDTSSTLSYVTLMGRTDPRVSGSTERAGARALAGFLRRMDVHSVVLFANELAHPEADAAWFTAYAGVATHLARFPGGVWVLRLEP